MPGTFYVTTPIYYINAEPHLGHAFTTILADVLKRYHESAGTRAWFLTGTDEHGENVARAAARSGETPEAYSDRVSALFRALWPRLSIEPDDFIRTTEERHKEVVRHILQNVHDSGDIYFSDYGGNYCYGCERFLTDKELQDGRCRDHGTEPTFIKEQNYFFRLEKYRDWLRDHLRRHPDFIRPEGYRREIEALLREPLDDLCISRPRSRLAWGIPLPFDDRFVTYVWFDALINYVSALGYPEGQLFRDLWQGAEHIIGKDILRPHGLYWPIMLHAAGIPLFRHLNVHGYWLIGEVKMSKSRGNIVRAEDLAETFGVDALRFLLVRDMPFAGDTIFTEKALIERYNTDLADDLGNLVHRITNMVTRYRDGRIPPLGDGGEEPELRAGAEKAIGAYHEHMQTFRLHQALDAMMTLVRSTNRFVEQMAPWSAARRGDDAAVDRTLRGAAEAVRIAALALAPVMPARCREIRERLGLPGEGSLLREARWGAIPEQTAVREGPPLFPKIG